MAAAIFAACGATEADSATVFVSGCSPPRNTPLAYRRRRPLSTKRLHRRRYELLRPETAKTTNVGVVFTPTFLPGFSATIDYTGHIKITGLIQSFGASTIQANCLLTADAASIWCQKIHRSHPRRSVDEFPGVRRRSAVERGWSREQGRSTWEWPTGSIWASWGKFRSRLDAGYLLKLLYTPGFGGRYHG